MLGVWDCAVRINFTPGRAAPEPPAYSLAWAAPLHTLGGANVFAGKTQGASRVASQAGRAPLVASLDILVQSGLIGDRTTVRTLRADPGGWGLSDLRPRWDHRGAVGYGPRGSCIGEWYRANPLITGLIQPNSMESTPPAICSSRPARIESQVHAGGRLPRQATSPRRMVLWSMTASAEPELVSHRD